MTVGDIINYFRDRDMFPDLGQEVRVSLDPGEIEYGKGTPLEHRGSVVPETGAAVLSMRPAPMRKYMFSLKFEANPVIEAHTVEEAEAKASEWMRHRAVVDTCTGDGDEGYVAQEPYFLEEVKE